MSETPIEYSILVQRRIPMDCSKNKVSTRDVNVNSLFTLNVFISSRAMHSINCIDALFCANLQSITKVVLAF